MVSRFVVFGLFIGLLSGCGDLPASGPTSKQIIAASANEFNTAAYEVIDVTPQVAATVSRFGGTAGSGRFSQLSPGGARGIGIGDTLAVTIFESSSGGLFGPNADEAGAPKITLPPQVVDRSGTISVPYAGSIPAQGRTPQQIQKTIEKRLASRAIEPQAIVSVVSNDSRLVTVTGDVDRGGRMPLSVGNERLLDVIALAGGPRGAAHDTYVKLTRGGGAEEMLVERLVNAPQENVVLRPGDQIFVYQKPQKFVALGANTINAEVLFGAETLMLSEALGKAGGLDDRRADPTGVFVFRYEDARAYQALGGTAGGGSGRVPLVYRLNLKQPDSLLAAQRFQLRNKDVVYFANSPSTELSKFLGLLGAGVGVTSGTATTVVRVTN